MRFLSVSAGILARKNIHSFVAFKDSGRDNLYSDVAGLPEQAILIERISPRLYRPILK